MNDFPFIPPAPIFRGFGYGFDFGYAITVEKQERIKKYTPKKVLKSGNATIVFWADGTKTVVKCAANEVPDDYDAFTAALAIKIFGSNSKLKKVIRSKTEIQKQKGEK